MLYVHPDHQKWLKIGILKAKHWGSKPSVPHSPNIKNTAILKQNFIKRGYKENILKYQIDMVDNIDWKDFFFLKKK